MITAAREVIDSEPCCHRAEPWCRNFGKPAALRIRHNRSRTRFWWGSDCCPTEPQPSHSPHISEDMKRLAWTLNNWPDVFRVASERGLVAPMLAEARAGQ